MAAFVGSVSLVATPRASLRAASKRAPARCAALTPVVASRQLAQCRSAAAGAAPAGRLMAVAPRAVRARASRVVTRAQAAAVTSRHG